MKNEKGFSLVEILIVIALIAIVVTIAFMSGDVVKKHRLTAASRQLYGDFQKVRVDAMTRSIAASSRGWGVRFNSNTQYTIFEFNDINTADNYQYDGPAEEANTKTVDMPGNVTVEIAGGALPTGDVRIYDKKGIIRTITWSQASAGRTYVMRYTGISEARCIVLSDTVRIREGVWDGSNCTKQ